MILRKLCVIIGIKYVCPQRHSGFVYETFLCKNASGNKTVPEKHGVRVF